METKQNSAARWFSIVVWLGIAFNVLFVAEELFMPDSVNSAVGLPLGLPNVVWNQAHAMMVLALTISISLPRWRPCAIPIIRGYWCCRDSWPSASGSSRGAPTPPSFLI